MGQLISKQGGAEPLSGEGRGHLEFMGLGTGELKQLLGLCQTCTFFLLDLFRSPHFTFRNCLAPLAIRIWVVEFGMAVRGRGWSLDMVGEDKRVQQVSGQGLSMFIIL